MQIIRFKMNLPLLYPTMSTEKKKNIFIIIFKIIWLKWASKIYQTFIVKHKIM